MKSPTVQVPLAHPQRITTTDNYGEPCVAIAFATSGPGEPLADFKQRLLASDYYSRTRGVELVLDREAATANRPLGYSKTDQTDGRVLGRQPLRSCRRRRRDC